MNAARLNSIVLVFAFFSLFGCETQKPHPDALAGWHFASLAKLHSNAAIMSDYQNYIRELPPKRKDFVGSVHFLGDGKGQHAVDIGIGVRGSWWRHILIYNQANERTKVIVYKTGGYQS